MSTSHPTTPPLPCPPFFNIPNIHNLRDVALALYPPSLTTSHPPTSTPGTKIRPFLLFRSGNVSNLDRAGWAAVKRLGVAVVFDLRSKPEIEKVDREKNEKEKGGEGDWMKVLEEEGLKRVWCPVFEDSDYSPERLAERYMGYMDEGEDGFIHAYHDILTHAGPAYNTILTYLFSLPSTPSSHPQGALIHCTAGKDRTGVLIALLLSFLGVSPDLIAHEYHLTEAGLQSAREQHIAKLMRSGGFMKFMASRVRGKDIGKEEMVRLIAERGMHLGTQEGEEGLDGVEKEVLEEGRRAAERMVSARKETMRRTLEMVEREWGSAEGYFRTVCGLGEGELRALRGNLVVADGNGDRDGAKI